MKRVVIVGGGFAGSYCAKKLEKYFDVTLIDSKDYFEFTPSVLRVLVEPEHLDKIHISHKNYLKKSSIILGYVDKISDKSVFVDGDKLDYDYLIISSGSAYEAPFKSQKIIHPHRGSELKKHSKELEDAESVLVVGGGLVGVELVGEILGKYPDKKITLLQRDLSLIPRNNKKSGDLVKKLFLEKNVDLIFGREFVDRDSKNFDVVLFCTGIKPNAEYLKDKIKTDEFMRLSGKKNVFVGGDVANLREEKTGQNAVEHAKIIVENIFRNEKGKSLIKYSLKKRPFIISLGKKKAILEYRNFVWFGKIPALLKNFVERRHMKFLVRKH